MNKLIKVILIANLLLVLAFPKIVVAHGDDEDHEGVGHSLSETIEEKQQELRERAEKRAEKRKERIASKEAERKEKLDERRQRICEKTSEQVKKRSEQLTKRAEKQLNVFSSIAQRVDNYYLNKLVPKGVTISNYDSLKADIESAKQEVNTTIDSAKNAVENFDCSGDNPKSYLHTFNVEMKDTIAALKDYRTSIKNFIVAIRTSMADKNSTSSAESEE